MRIVGLIGVAVLSVAARPPAETGLQVVQASGEPALQIDKTVLPRPFGAQPVDKLTIVASQALAARRLWVVQGSTTGPCANRFVVVEQPRRGGTARISPLFGNCGGFVSAVPMQDRLRITTGGPDGAPVGYVYANGIVEPVVALAAAPPKPVLSPRSRRRAAAATPTVAAAPAPNPPPPPVYAGPTTLAIDAWAGTGGCRTFDRAARLRGTPAYGESDARLAEFDRAYPREWRRRGGIKDVEFTPAELRRAVTGLACLSTWPGADPLVPDAAAALFASRRHGTAAFEQLDGIARGGVVDPNLRAAARAFHAQMRYVVGKYGRV